MLRVGFGQHKDRSQETAPQSVFLLPLSHSLWGWLLVSSLELPGVKIVGRELELPIKSAFPETATIQPLSGRQEVTADDSGDDKGK